MTIDADLKQNDSKNDSNESLRLSHIILRILVAFGFYALILFLPAGSFDYTPGWVFLATLLVTFSLMLPYMYLNHPQALKRRMKRGEKTKAQRIIILFLTLGFYGGIVLCGLDFRFGWSQVPLYAVIAGNLIVGLSFLGVTWVTAVNEYAGATIEVDAKQKVVTSGPYALVRHPMYFFIVLASLALPIGLGSFWAFPLFAFVIPITLHFRMLNEEAMLCRELSGYPEYCDKVRSRVIPFIW